MLGCLLEKARTTPDQYPLSLNAVATACNQSTNRWPVVRYDDDTVEAALDELRVLGLVRREKPYGGRAIKYSELVRQVVPLGEPELGLLAVLLLRGAQTPGELKARTERLHHFADLGELDATLGRLAAHEDGAIVQQLPREAGRKESRWRDCWQPSGDDPPPSTDPPRSADTGEELAGRHRVASVTADDLVVRVAALEARVAELASRLDGLVSGIDR